MSVNLRSKAVVVSEQDPGKENLFFQESETSRNLLTASDSVSKKNVIFQNSEPQIGMKWELTSLT